MDRLNTDRLSPAVTAADYRERIHPNVVYAFAALGFNGGLFDVVRRNEK